ncbi:cell division protein FtsZ [Pseudahrensia aquimaris]|uniref:Cell division protein FtsZ n=1 Tax=Pseudahrensia aquimaris TaxID=744461 RepID=A0ABW3FCU5_9HYPH
MTINLHKPDITELKPRITVFGVGGGGGNAVNNMITSGLDGVDFVVANTDAQALTMSKSERLIQMGVAVTEGLGAGSQPEVGAAAAEECIDEIRDHLSGTHMAFVTAGMGGGTGTGAAPVVARAAREAGILTVGVVTKPFSFEGKRRLELAENGIAELQKHVDTLIVIPNQNLFRIANEKTTFADAFAMADQVLYSGVACITDLMVKEGLINLDFADVRSVMRDMGRAMMGTGESSGEGRAINAAEAAISNPLLDETSMSGASGLLISITGGRDMTLFEVDEAATRIREEVDPDANIILGATFDEDLEGIIRVSVVATGIDGALGQGAQPSQQRFNEAAERLRQSAAARTAALTPPAAAAAAEIAETSAAVEQAEEELAIAEPSHAVPFQPESADFADPISDADFQSALEIEIGTEASDPSPADIAASAAPTSPAPVAASNIPDPSQFSPMAQQQMAASAKPAPAPEESNGPMGLFKRLANGLGTSHNAERAQPAAVAPKPEAPAVPAPQPAVERAPVSAYAPPRDGALDVHGRPATAARPATDEDQLDIPAFLRRQAN